MALTDLSPATRVEEILAGEEISPATRLEYFLQQAAQSGGSAPVVLDLTTFDDLTVTGGAGYVVITAPTADLSELTDTAPSYVRLPNVSYNALDQTYSYDNDAPGLYLVQAVANGDVYVNAFPLPTDDPPFVSLSITNGGN